MLILPTPTGGYDYSALTELTKAVNQVTADMDKLKTQVKQALDQVKAAVDAAATIKAQNVTLQTQVSKQEQAIAALKKSAKPTPAPTTTRTSQR